MFSKLCISLYKKLLLLQFYNPLIAVRLKMCEIDTVNVTLGKEIRFGNELIGSEFN
jgi:hypothetical protein